ncbi:MAG: hypothetical protein ACR2P3_07620 [Geminicoccaceae bacterium]
MSDQHSYTTAGTDPALPPVNGDRFEGKDHMSTAHALPGLKLRVDWDEEFGYWVAKDLNCLASPLRATTLAELLAKICRDFERHDDDSSSRPSAA